MDERVTQHSGRHHAWRSGINHARRFHARTSFVKLKYRVEKSPDHETTRRQLPVHDLEGAWRRAARRSKSKENPFRLPIRRSSCIRRLRSPRPTLLTITFVFRLTFSR